jgi:hypothetical protein
VTAYFRHLPHVFLDTLKKTRIVGLHVWIRTQDLPNIKQECYSCNLKKQVGRLWIGFIWLRIGTSGGIL